MTTKAIIFDKDGTLFPYSLWEPVVKRCLSAEMPLEKLGDEERKKTVEDFSIILGIDGTGKIHKDGLFFSHNYILSFFRLSWCVIKHRLNPVKSALGFMKIKKRYLYGHEEALSSYDFSPLVEKLDSLKRRNISLALFTNDSKEAVDMFLSSVGEDFFSFTLHSKSPHKKPDPKAIEDYALSSKVEKKAMILISDSPRDLKMGKKGNVGLTVAIEGTADREKLEKYADLIFPDIVSALSYLLDSVII